MSIQADIDQLLVSLRERAEIGLHLGCGPTRVKGLINCDFFNNEKADLRVDSTKLDCIADNSVNLIEHHHMIEHLSFDEVDAALREWLRVLKLGGYLIFTCPEINAVLRRWFRSRHYWKYNSVIKMIYGSQEHGGMFHKSGFDKRRIREILQPLGLSIEFSYMPYPLRPTPSLLTIARKKSA